MCRVLRVHRSGYYAWLKAPRSVRSIEDQRLLGLIKMSHAAADGVYGSPRVFRDLREEGETCGRNRVARIMKAGRLQGIQLYKRTRYVKGAPAVLAPNHLQREFTVDAPDRV